MRKRTLEYFEWSDVERYICNKLNIDPAQFRDYHKVIGGEYKDLLCVWLSFNPYDISNDSYVTTWLDDDYEMENNFERIIREYGDWVECLRPILIDMREEFGDALLIHYSW